MTSPLLIALIPLAPLAAAALSAILGPRSGRASSALAVGAMTLSLVLALRALGIAWDADEPQVYNFVWFSFNGLPVEFGLVLDRLSAPMVAMVTFVGLLIFIYAGSYMAHDPRKGRFFCYLSLFASGMLGMVLSNSLLLFFMCWEIIGLTSYLLIGFWYEKPSAAAAAKKAFITTRIGDLGFLLGLLLAFKVTGTLLFFDSGNGMLEDSGLQAFIETPALLPFLGAAGLTALLLFSGAVGKSGQFPLHVWLPDAMEGPTPVSALIHAATMVAAGVYLVARAFPIFTLQPDVLQVVGWVGAITALMAALIAVGQYDIKRILAYSTVSQLGLMMVGIAVGGPGAGMFHLLTHAFFKALLFLGAGSVIHGCEDRQDIREMGGVGKAMPVTAGAYLAGVLALCAFPFTAGYFSKDEILLRAQDNPGLFWVCAVASFFTALYMARQCCYVFLGGSRSHLHMHESPKQMTLPLVVLAVFALAGGAVAMKLGLLERLDGAPVHVNHSTFVVVVGWTVALGGLLVGYLLYGLKGIKAGETDIAGRALPTLYRAFENRFYLDEIYAATVGRVWTFCAAALEFLNDAWAELVDHMTRFVRALGTFCAEGDRKGIDSAAFDGTCSAIRSAGGVVSEGQSGFLSRYLRVMALGLACFGFLCVRVWFFA